MKKLFILFFALSFVWVSGSFAQNNTLTIPDVTGPVGSVSIPVNYNFEAEGVCAFTLSISYDGAVMDYVGYDNYTNNGTVFGSAPGANPIILTMTGASNINDAGQLLTLEFDYFGGFSPIEFNVVSSTLSNCDITPGAITPVSYIDGSIDQAAAVPLANWAIIFTIGLIIVVLAVSYRRIF